MSQEEKEPHSSEINNSSAEEENSDNEEEVEDIDIEYHEDYVKQRREVDLEECCSGIDKAFLALDNSSALECVWQEVHLDNDISSKSYVRLTNEKYKDITNRFEKLCDLEHPNLVNLRRFWIDYQYCERHELEQDRWHDVETAFVKYNIADENIEELIDELEYKRIYEYLEPGADSDKEADNHEGSNNRQYNREKLISKSEEKHEIKFRLVFVTEYFQAGTIDTHFREKDDSTNNPSNETVVRWLIQILSALDYLHTQTPDSIVHANLSCKAIFRHHNGNFKLGGYWYDTIMRHVLGRNERSPTAYYDRRGNRETKDRLPVGQDRDFEKNKSDAEPTDVVSPVHQPSTGNLEHFEASQKEDTAPVTDQNNPEKERDSKSAVTPTNPGTTVPLHAPNISVDIFAFGVCAIIICKPSIIKEILDDRSLEIRHEKKARKSNVKHYDIIAEVLSKNTIRNKYIRSIKSFNKSLAKLIESCCRSIKVERELRENLKNYLASQQKRDGNSDENNENVQNGLGQNGLGQSAPTLPEPYPLTCQKLLKDKALLAFPSLKLMACRKLIDYESDEIYDEFYQADGVSHQADGLGLGHRHQKAFQQIDDTNLSNDRILIWWIKNNGDKCEMNMKKLKRLLERGPVSVPSQQGGATGSGKQQTDKEKQAEKAKKTNLNLQTFYEDVRNGVYALNVNYQKNTNDNDNEVNENDEVVTFDKANSQTTDLIETESLPTYNNNNYPSQNTNTLTNNAATTTNTTQPRLKDCEIKIERANFKEINIYEPKNENINPASSDNQANLNDQNNNSNNNSNNSPNSKQPNETIKSNNIITTTKYAIDFNVTVHLSFLSGKLNTLKTKNVKLHEFKLMTDDIVKENFIYFGDRHILDSTFERMKMTMVNMLRNNYGIERENYEEEMFLEVEEYRRMMC